MEIVSNNLKEIKPIIDSLVERSEYIWRVL